MKNLLSKWEAQLDDNDVKRRELKSELVNIFTDVSMFAKYPDLMITGTDLQSWLEVSYKHENFRLDFVRLGSAPYIASRLPPQTSSSLDSEKSSNEPKS